MAIRLKNVHETASPEDGTRVLVDRKWPRNVAKRSAALWFTDLAPADELQRWFDGKPHHWTQFRRDYLAGLSNAKAVIALRELHTIAAGGTDITLLTSAKDEEYSHAAILRDLLTGVRKPPSTSGPTQAASATRIRARRSR